MISRPMMGVIAMMRAASGEATEIAGIILRSDDFDLAWRDMMTIARYDVGPHFCGSGHEPPWFLIEWYGLKVRVTRETPR